MTRQTSQVPPSPLILRSTRNWSIPIVVRDLPSALRFILHDAYDKHVKSLVTSSLNVRCDYGREFVHFTLKNNSFLLTYMKASDNLNMKNSRTLSITKKINILVSINRNRLCLATAPVLRVYIYPTGRYKSRHVASYKHNLRVYSFKTRRFGFILLFWSKAILLCKMHR